MWGAAVVRDGALVKRAWAVAVAVSLASGIALGQTRFRRPCGPAPVISYGYDNNGGAGGCRDYTCGGRCYDGHTGTDIPVGLGTTVLAGAAGTVVATNNGCANYGAVGNTCGGRCGNYVQLQHADGTRSIYCHMQLDSIMVRSGQSVSCGQPIGRSASSGSSSGPHLHFGWQSGGVSRDPFSGGCSNGGGRWVAQQPYPNSPGDACEGPPPPPPCEARVGPFGWNCSGPLAGMTCTNTSEPSDPDTWGDNFFCSDIDRGLRWSSAGPIAGMTCAAVNESSEPASHTWGDNFLCAPTWLPYRFQFATAGPVAGMTCLKWAEPADPHTWDDNFLCWTRDTDCARREGPFAWSCAGPVAGMSCTQVHESSDPDTWDDNFLCAASDLGLRWSSAGAIAGMDCTAIGEGSEPTEHTWTDNFLCAPRGSGYSFRWSTAGPVAGMSCLQWYEPSDPHTWEDNFLCWTYTPPPPVDAGVPSNDAGARVDVSAVDVGATDVGDREVGVTDAGARDVGATDAGSTYDVSVANDVSGVDGGGEEPLLTPADESGGCGCTASGRGHGAGALAWAAVAMVAALRRRRRS